MSIVILKPIFIDVLYLIKMLKQHQIYDCKRVIYNNLYIYGLNNTTLFIRAKTNNSILYLTVGISPMIESMQYIKNYDVNNLIRFNDKYHKTFLFKNYQFLIYEKYYNKRKKLIEGSYRKNLNVLCFIDKLPIELIYKIATY